MKAICIWRTFSPWLLSGSEAVTFKYGQTLGYFAAKTKLKLENANNKTINVDNIFSYL
jgi:hypothetical protein